MHVAIIMDGNRRYARKRGLPPERGHQLGVKKVEDLIRWCPELGIKELTLYAFSMENFNRNQKEKDHLMKIFKKRFEELIDHPEIEKNRVRVRVIGRISMFPEDVQEKMQNVVKKTAGNDNYTVNFAMAYGGRQEIVDMAKALAKEVKEGKLSLDEIDEKVVGEHMYLDSDPDIVIRTGGERRVSNFMLWQANYSEWFFLDKMWPELGKEDLAEAISEYKKRERRFGK